jgi:uncharacterized protein (DUF433 family)
LAASRERGWSAVGPQRGTGETRLALAALRGDRRGLRAAIAARIPEHVRIRDATEAVRNTFDDEYGLATRRIATDGVDIFVEYADGELARARDGQRPIREVITDYLHYISWEPGEQYPYRLRLRQYPDVAPVIIDPRFGWGAPVVEGRNIQVDAIVGMWKAGESLETVAAEYGLSRDQVEAVCQVATRDQAA